MIFSEMPAAPGRAGRLGPRGTERRGKIRAALLLGLVVALAGLALSHWAPAETLEDTGLDLLFVLRGPRANPANVCVVAMDDESYGELGVSPGSAWPRRRHAELIRELKKQGARAVAFDVVFEGARDADDDAALEAALREAGNVVLGASVDVVADPRYRRVKITEPYSPFKEAAAAVGSVSCFLTEREHGVIRRTLLVQDDLHSLALAAYEVATGDLSLEAERKDRLIDYYGWARTVPTVSYYQALDAERSLPEHFFDGKIVFVGDSQGGALGADARDSFVTPFRGRHHPPTFGVEIHATAASNLIEKRRIDLLPPLIEGTLLFLLSLAATSAFMALRPLYGLIALLILEAGWWAGAHLAFDYGQIWLPVMIPSIALLPAAYVLSLVWYYLTTVRERERIRRAFTFYLSPQMIEKIVADPSSLNLGGEEIVATAVFTDIKGFTPIAESMAAPDTAALLNRYFSRITRFIFEEGGTLIKFIGDAVFAIWGAPVRAEDHAARACKAALAIARAHRSPEADEATARLVTRIGVHMGPMLVGNLGSQERFDYTAIGDAVNFAARLEGLNKYFGTRALVSGVTLAQTDAAFVVRGLGGVRVVGKQEPVEIFELLGLKGEQTVPPADALARFERALADFQARRFAEAASGFREVRAACGDAGDGPSDFYIGECERMLREPPPVEWDGAIVFEKK